MWCIIRGRAGADAEAPDLLFREVRQEAEAGLGLFLMNGEIIMEDGIPKHEDNRKRNSVPPNPKPKPNRIPSFL